MRRGPGETGRDRRHEANTRDPHVGLCVREGNLVRLPHWALPPPLGARWGFRRPCPCTVVSVPPERHGWTEAVADLHRDPDTGREELCLARD